MVKFYSSAFSYDYSFPAVCLAHVLRYPNPYSTHVVSIDTIDQQYDQATQRLTTTRLLLKKSKIPPAILKLLPKSLGARPDADDSQSYVLEKSVVDVHNGRMHTQSQNLEFRSILSVVEDQHYERVDSISGTPPASADQLTTGTTKVFSTVTLRSHVGETLRKRRALVRPGADVTLAERNDMSVEDTENDHQQLAPPRQGFFRNLTTGSLQRSIEVLGLRRTEGSQPNAKAGMNVVLERLRTGGLVCVLEGMAKDREAAGLGQGYVPALATTTRHAASQPAR